MKINEGVLLLELYSDLLFYYLSLFLSPSTKISQHLGRILWVVLQMGFLYVNCDF